MKPIQVPRLARTPRPLVLPQVVAKVLNRHTLVKSPESRLCVAVITAAIADCLSPSAKTRAEARRFILGPRLARWADAVGLELDFVRAIAREAGYLADHTRPPAVKRAARTSAPRKEPAHA